MKKVFISLLVIVSILTVTGCAKKEDNKSALLFKEEYEALNGVVNKAGKEHRTLSISEENPYVKVTPEEIVKMIEEDKKFYLYVGDPLCPWCRSVLEKSIEVAKEYKIDKIYYIDIWDDEGNEILRDKYEIVDNELVKTVEGTDAYNKLLKAFDKLLRDYTITDSEGNTVETLEKRIYAPNYFYIKKGEAVKIATGKSEKLTDARAELTEEILKDQEELFEEFFTDLCDESC